jgi:hypothetical protein
MEAGRAADRTVEARRSGLGPTPEKRRSTVSEKNHNYDVQVDWPTVAPLGDTLAVSTGSGVDDQWVDAFEVVLREDEARQADRTWRRIEFEQGSGDYVGTVDVLVREIEPGTESAAVRRTVEELVRSANTVARVGTHVYELARELRQTEPPAPRVSTPPPSRDPLDDELRLDAA